MRSIASTYMSAKNDLHRSAPWVWLVDIDLPTPLYLSNVSDSIYWGDEVAVLDRREYVPGHFDLDLLASNADGQLPEIRARIFNTKAMAYKVETYTGFSGYDALLSLVYVEQSGGYWTFPVSRDSYALSFPMLFDSGQIGSPYIQFKVTAPRWYRRKMGRIYQRDWCDVAYKEDWCWMTGRTEVAGEETDCDHTYAACKAHWTYQSKPTTGVRFPGWPTVGKGAYRYS